MQLGTPVIEFPGINASRAIRYAKLGLRTARDVLFFFPRQHEFPPPPVRIDQIAEGQSASFAGTITDVELMSRSPGKSVFGAVVENEQGAIRILFFNQPFRAETITFGARVRVEGTFKLNGLRWEIVHPRVMFLEPDESFESSRGGKILPVYPLTEGVKQHELRRLTAMVIDELADGLAEVMPPSLRQVAAKELSAAGLFAGDELPTIARTIRGIHHPQTAEQLGSAQTRLVYQELLVMQLALAMRRVSLTAGLRATPLECTPQIQTRIMRRFPFELTGDQKRVIDTIAGDMGRQFPMNRLLQGDVGSGKTVVAAFAMLLAVAGGHQAALMAPTEVLARQHAATFTRWLAGSKTRVGLLCGSLSASERRGVTAAAASGEIDLLIGTQALLYDVPLKSLAVCVIDEQHKFGVRQRVRLRSGGIDPHCLVMSATPIPRSVAMTQFGDVDLSTIRDKPSGRGGVHTYLADDQWRDRWWSFVRQRIAEGRQAFVVAPRVGNGTESNEEPLVAPENLETPEAEPTEDVSSVVKTFDDLSKGPLSGLRLALLHGRMPAEEKQRVMEWFAEGEIDVLVSTTVIEVGIDVPNATVMTILGGNRFGLAQLHQLRGRVSRGVHAGHVCVFTDGDRSPRDEERLRIFESTSDGFELAEADFRLRGPGELLGQRQSGSASLRIADLARDVEVLEVARRVAQEMIDDDSELSDPSLALLKQQVLKRYADRLELGDSA